MWTSIPAPAQPATLLRSELYPAGPADATARATDWGRQWLLNGRPRRCDRLPFVVGAFGALPRGTSPLALLSLSAAQRFGGLHRLPDGLSGEHPYYRVHHDVSYTAHTFTHSPMLVVLVRHPRSKGPERRGRVFRRPPLPS